VAYCSVMCVVHVLVDEGKGSGLAKEEWGQGIEVPHVPTSSVSPSRREIRLYPWTQGR
jgi:hypothetical protein